eukprot:5557198-Prorocentrum_lima.AAC.1
MVDLRVTLKTIVFVSEGINLITTLHHTTLVERFIRAAKSAIHGSAIFTGGKWEDMLRFK